ncbi:zinc finger protein 107-like isoform X1 [Falco naumanni]|uniref:zinc finger protein 107-like isoform X1 n=1 Tax=Falco naumanni TaxID=148594 RepID=UPI001ADE543E|nr:zinc finger protein 107-like isoform X1 [Falco naumanni]
MSVKQGSSELADDSESNVFEIVLPITILVLSDDDFLWAEAEEQAASVPELRKESKQEGHLNNRVFLKSDVTPANDSDGLSILEENKPASNKDCSVKYSEEPWVAESACNNHFDLLSDHCDADTDKYRQNDMLPTLSCKTQLTEVNKISDGEKCDSDDGFQIRLPLSSADSEGRDDTIGTSGQLTLTVVSQHEEELVSVASVLSDGGQETQPEIHKETEAVVKMEDPDSSKNGENEANNIKGSKNEDETLSSLLEHGLKEEAKFTYNCSAPLLNGCSPNSEELLKDVGKPETNTSPSAASNTTGEHICETLRPRAKKRYRKQKVVSPHASPKEFQSQQEGLACLSNSVTIKRLSKASCSLNKNERLNLKCRLCNSVCKSTTHLKKHIYSAHKYKKIHKSYFCKRIFLFSVNLKNRLKFRKKITTLQKARKNRINARKVRQRRSKERKSDTKKKESKYEKFFIRIERDFTPLGVPISFSCKICFFASSKPRIFIHHMKGHKERPPYQCPQCDYSCVSLSYLLNHMYWHAGYKLYQCRFCTFFSLYYASMVRHSYVHTGTKLYSCEFCQFEFTGTTGLNRHRRLCAGKETCQEQQLHLGGRKRTQRPLKNYTCGECNIVFYTRGRLSFHKKCHEQFKATANSYTNWSNEYHKSKICESDSDSKDCVSLSLSGKENCLNGGMLASEVEFERADDVWDNKKMCSGKKFPENSHGSSSLPVIGNKSEAPLNSYNTDAIISKEGHLFDSKACHSQVQDDNAYHKFVENLKDVWPLNLSTFKTYKCQHCNYATAVHSDFKLHLEIHTDGRPFVCKECNKTFKTSNHLQKHSVTHIKDGYEFGHSFYVDNSLENLELCRKISLCPERDLAFLEGSNGIHSLHGSEVCGLQPDVRRGEENYLLAQSQPQFYQCAECEYATYVLGNLEVHVRTHTGEKPYSCGVCQKKFRTSSHLRRHSVTHFNIGYLKCRSCDYSTNKWLSLKKHLASHSSEESSSTGWLCEQKLLPFKIHTCEVCGYCTARNGNLKLHLRIHTGEKPFKCGQCAVAFRTSSHLKRHLLTH